LLRFSIRGRVPSQSIAPGLFAGTRESADISGIRLNKGNAGCLTSSAYYSGWILVQSVPGLYSLLGLVTLVDLRVVEVRNAQVNLVGSTEDPSYRRFRVGCQPSPEMVRDFPAVEEMGRRRLAAAGTLQGRLAWVKSFVVVRKVTVV
jgi:hypothetical protein